MNTLIVIATNNGNQYIDNCIDKAKLCNPGTDILIVDTGSTDQNYIQKLHNQYQDITLFTVDKNYDSGAYIRAYSIYKEKYKGFMFIQDSVYFKRHGIIQELENNNGDFSPWLVFKQGYDTHNQYLFVLEKLGIADLPGYGVFGPIFYASTKALQMLEDKNLLTLLPSNKEEQMACERGWAVAFNCIEIEPQPIEGEFHGPYIHQDFYKSFTKILPYRH